MTAEHPVARYYDRNTGRFLRFGRSGRVRGIHRELWGPGVSSPAQASNWINRLLAREIARLPGLRAGTLVATGDPGSGGEAPSDSGQQGKREAPSSDSAATEPAAYTWTAPVVLDMGCGVGGTLFELARTFPLGSFHGITISPRQHGIAEALGPAEDPAGRCRFVLGDFEEARLGFEADVVLAVEAFVHSANPDSFLARAAEHLCPGGRLIIVDDFLARPSGQLDGAERRVIERFRSGWRVPGVCTTAELAERALGHGFGPPHEQDLTGLVRLGRPRDRAIALLSPWLERLGLVDVPFFANMIGGNALQEGLRSGLLRYVMVVFERTATAGG